MRWQSPVASIVSRSVILLLIGTISGGAGAQGPPADAAAREKPAASRLSGRVVAADTGKPLRGAVVHVAIASPRTPGEQDGRWVTADANGRWTLADLAPGGYTVSASKGGYLTIRYGQKRPFEPGKTIVLAAGQPFDNADLVLPRSGAIAGRLLDAFGDPVTGALVRVLRHKYVDGRRQMQPVAEGLEALVQGGITDDQGNYRLFGLTPGDYYVCAVYLPRGDSADRVGYTTTYYPGTAAPAEARRVSLGVGQEASNISFTLSRTRYATVAGLVVGSTGAPIQATLTLRGSGDGELVSIPSATANASTGAFTIRNVPPGEYRLDVHTSGAGAQNPTGVMEFATVPVSVEGEDVAGLVIATAPGARASGRVEFAGTLDIPGRVYIRTLPLNAGSPEYLIASTGLDADATFELRGLAGRHQIALSTLPDGWFLESVVHEGRDITDEGYDFQPGRHVTDIRILLSRTATTLSGTARDAAGRPAPDFTVVAFSSDKSRWGYRTRFVRSARPDQDGRFTLRGLPPDEYLVVAAEYVETGQELDPAQLEAWTPVATRVTLGAGESRTITLRLIP